MGQAPGRLVFRIHALRRMFSCGVDVAGVRAILETGSVVEGYPDDEEHLRYLEEWNTRTVVDGVEVD